jgi:hypothetical protein
MLSHEAFFRFRQVFYGKDLDSVLREAHEDILETIKEYLFSVEAMEYNKRNGRPTEYPS